SLLSDGIVSGDHQRDPVQVIALLSENRFDLVARSEAVMRPFLSFPLGRMRAFHDAPPTFGKSSHAFSSVDGASIGEASSLPSRGSPGRNHPMRQRVPDELQDFAGDSIPDGKQTSTKDRGVLRYWNVAITQCAPTHWQPHSGSPPLDLHLAFLRFA